MLLDLLEVIGDYDALALAAVGRLDNPELALVLGHQFVQLRQLLRQSHSQRKKLVSLGVVELLLHLLDLLA